MSPILIRPVREQLEHDRVIRLLQAKWKRRLDVAVNVGDERVATVKLAQSQLYPDLVLSSTETPKRVMGVVEVETGESVNNLEAMAQWAHFSKVRAPFYLYVPIGSIDIARRLCAGNQVVPTELWAYSSFGDQIRFSLVERHPAPEIPAARPERPAAPPKPAKPVRTGAAEKAAKPVVREKAAKAVKPAKAAKVRKVAKPRPSARAKAARPLRASKAPARAAASRRAPGRKASTRTSAKPAARSRKRR